MIALTNNDSVLADEFQTVSWHFSHTQDIFAALLTDRETNVRSAGLTNIGLKLKSQSLPISFFLNGLWVTRDDPFTMLINDFNGVSNIAGDESARIYHAVLNYGDSDSTWSGSMGLQVIDDNFIGIEEASLLINSGFGMASVVTGNTFIPTFPKSAIGMHLRYKDRGRRFYTAFGIYDGNAGDENSHPHRPNISLNISDGLAIIGEVGWEIPCGGKNPGQLKLGVWHHTGEFMDNRLAQIRHHNSALYAIFNGHFSVNNKRFGYFGRISRMSKINRSQIAHGLEGGLNWQGAIGSRPRDTLSLGLVWSHFADASIASQQQNRTNFVNQDEWVFELTYEIKANNWLRIQPDLQWIVNPHNAEKNAILAGARINIDF